MRIRHRRLLLRYLRTHSMHHLSRWSSPTIDSAELYFAGPAAERHYSFESTNLLDKSGTVVLAGCRLDQMDSKTTLGSPLAKVIHPSSSSSFASFLGAGSQLKELILHRSQTVATHCVA